MIFLEKPEDFNSILDAVGCFLEYENKVLFLQRSAEKSEGGAWAPPGGKVELADAGDFKKAAAREILEETGIVIEERALMLIGTFYVRYPDRDVTYYKYRLTLDSKSSVALRAEEHQNYAWLTPTEALQMSLMKDEDFTIRYAYSL